jgi:cytochrome c-type biogenesis protein CcmH/NrfG
VHSHPKDAEAWLQLARAYQADNQSSQAITAYQTYLGLKPKDQTVLSGTASLLEQRGQKSAQKLLRYQAAAAAYTQVESATAASSLKLAGALTHPLLTTLAQPAQTQARTLETSAITDYAEAMGLRQKLVNLSPRNATYQYLLAQDAYATQSYATVAKALEAYLKLEPNLSKSNRTQLEKEIAQFKLLAKSSPSSSSGSSTSSGG